MFETIPDIRMQFLGWSPLFPVLLLFSLIWIKWQITFLPWLQATLLGMRSRIDIDEDGLYFPSPARLWSCLKVKPIV